MGEVSFVGGAGPVGTWDEDLFRRFRAAPKGRSSQPGKPPDPRSALRRFLLGELIRINTPLIKTLVAQIQGKPPPDRLRGKVRTAMRLVGAEELEWDDALSLGRFAFTKCMDRYDPRKGKVSGYLLKKIYYELQCAVQAASMVRVERGAKAPGLCYLEDDEQLGRLALEDDEEDEAPQFERIEEIEENEGAPLAAVIAEPPVTATAIALLQVLAVPVDTRSALEVFLEEHCRFARALRTPMTAVDGRCHDVVSARGEVLARGELARALRDRGVRPITMRAPWSASPVKGLAGIGLQSAAN
jgi:hypothetical protein